MIPLKKEEERKQQAKHKSNKHSGNSQPTVTPILVGFGFGLKLGPIHNFVFLSSL